MESLSYQITAEHGQFIVYNGKSGNQPEYDGDGLLSPYDGGVVVSTGRTYGLVDVVVELHDSRPELPPQIWSEVSEVSVNVASGPLALGELTRGSAADARDLAHDGLGWYRMRVAARGRDESATGRQTEPNPESFLIQVWPSGPGRAETLRSSDRVGRHHRGERPTRPYLPQEADEIRQAFHTLIDRLFPVLPRSARRTVQVSRVVSDGLQRVLDVLHGPSLLLFWFGEGGIPPVANGEWKSFWVPANSLSIRGEVQYTAQGLTSSWNWEMLTSPTPEAPFPRFVSALETPAILYIEATASGSGSAISVRHDGLPDEISQQMEVLWAYYLDRLALYLTHEEFSDHPWN